MRGDPLPIRKLPASSLSGNGSNGRKGVPVPIKADGRLGMKDGYKVSTLSS